MFGRGVSSSHPDHGHAMSMHPHQPVGRFDAMQMLENRSCSASGFQNKKHVGERVGERGLGTQRQPSTGIMGSYAWHGLYIAFERLTYAMQMQQAK